MIHELKPYQAYKDSGVSWLGDIPAHWSATRNKLILEERNDRSEDGSEELLTVSQHTGVTRRREKFSSEGELLTRATSLVGYKRVESGNLVMNIMLAWNGSLGVSPTEGIVSPAYCVFRIANSLHPRFLHYLLRTGLFTGIFKTVSTGVVDSRLRLYPDKFLSLPSLLPPFSEQASIGRFLDYTCLRIQRYIRAKKKLIALLNEKKQVNINRAVTRGFDPTVRLKPSGVEWLGEVPEHWTVSRLKFEALEIVDCLHATPHYTDDGEHPAIRTADIEPGRVRIGTARRVNREQYDLWTSRLAPKAGDILYSREGERFGLAALVPPGVSLCISQRMMVFRIRPTQDSSFIMWQLNSGHVYAQAAADVIGATSPHVNVERIKNFWIILPPLQEQKLIADRVAAECRALQLAIGRIESELELVHEYRTRLIADVVTGKLDVREAAARLPEEVEDLEPLDEGEALAEEDDEGEDAEGEDSSEEAVA